MTVTMDFRVFQIDAQFSRIQTQEEENVIANLSSSGKPAPFSFMVFANFERGSLEYQSEDIYVHTECRVTFNRVPVQITPIEITIPSGVASTTKSLGLCEIRAGNVDVDQQPISLVIEFFSGQRCIASREYKVSFCKE